MSTDAANYKTAAHTKDYLSPENILRRWFTLMSGTLTTTAGGCIGNMAFLTGPGGNSVSAAMNYTIVTLVAFVMLGGFFYHEKAMLDKAAKEENREGITGISYKEALALSANEGIQNLTGAMASILAQIWFSRMHGLDGPKGILEVFAGGAVILIFGEYLQRCCRKGGMAEYIINMLNGLNVGSVSWWVGNSMSNYTQKLMGVPDGPSPQVQYWMWLSALLSGILFTVIVNFLASKSKKADGDAKPYGDVVFSMLKGVPMFSSGFILSNVVQNRYSNDYITGTLIWTTISTVIVVVFDQAVHKFQGDKNDKVAYGMMISQISVLSQSLAFVQGQLASFALAAYIPTASDSMWIVWGTVFQILGFLVEGARTRCLPEMFKEVEAREGYNELECE